MQEIMNKIKARAIELLSDGTVNRVIGWEKGETETDWSPALFETAEEMEGFVKQWNNAGYTNVKIGG